MNIPAKVDTSALFKAIVVDEDYQEFKRDPANLRLAYHLGLGLFHLRDWTFWEYGGTSTMPYSTMGCYQTYLESQCKDFGYIRDLANAVKHVELDPSKRPSTQMVGLANTKVSFAAFSSTAFQPNAFKTKTVIVSQTSPTDYVDFDKAADAVMSMWNRLFSTNGWK
jgi:hypothetical protein